MPVGSHARLFFDNRSQNECLVRAFEFKARGPPLPLTRKICLLLVVRQSINRKVRYARPKLIGVGSKKPFGIFFRCTEFFKLLSLGLMRRRVLEIGIGVHEGAEVD